MALSESTEKALKRYGQLIKNVRPAELRIKLNDSVSELVKTMAKDVQDEESKNLFIQAMKKNMMKG